MIPHGLRSCLTRFVLLLSLIGLLTGLGLAQGGGTISGTLKSTSGAPISGATVMAMNLGVTPMTMLHATTDAQGAYSFPNLPAGNYDIQIEAPGFVPDRKSGYVLAANARLTADLTMAPEPVQAVSADSTDPAALAARVKELEQRISDLESSTVLSEPETRVKRIEVYEDANSNISDTPAPGAKKVVTYQRERVYRRQTINEKIEEALSSEAENSVDIGVNAAIAAQGAFQTKGPTSIANRHAYELASADLFFSAKVAQHTLFFADVVGISGPPPDLEIGGLTLLNGFTARLVRQNELNLREAWLRTELFSQKLGLTAGRLDLTNYFDHNAAANDESQQFLSDALVNNPTLGLAVNGAGLAAVVDPKNGFNFKIGIQQSKTDALNLSQSLFSLAEVGLYGTPLGLGEGNYRFWYRLDNSSARYRTAYGTSLDQKLGVPQVTWFGRFGTAQADVNRDYFYSGGLQFSNGAGIFPGDAWGLGYAHFDTGAGPKERLAEGYYNFGLTERLRLSFHVTHVLEKDPTAPTVGFLVPGIRLQASF